MRKDRPSWQRMKLCALRCDIDDCDPMMLAAPAFTASRLRLLHHDPQSTAHHFSADIAHLHDMQLDRQDAAEREEARQKKLQDAAQSKNTYMQPSWMHRS